MSDLQKGIECLRTGQWDMAHAIAQGDPTPQGAWLHGIVHMAEGDAANARYWYNQARRPFPGMAAVEEELDRLEATLAPDDRPD